MEKKFFEAPATYVGQVSINVTDLKRSVDFYQQIVGFRVLERTENRAVLTADGKTPLLTLESPDDVVPKERRTAGLYHFAILLPKRSDLAAFLKHFIRKAQGQMQLGAGDHYVSEALYFNDPDGNGIEMASDRPSSEWNWANGQVDMATVALDADDLLSEAESEWQGLPVETIIGHMHLHVVNLTETKEFYVDGLGFSIVTKFPGALFTSTNGYHHHIALNIWKGEDAQTPAKNSVGLRWFTLLFPDEDSLMQALRRLEDIDVSAKELENGYEVEDPAGNVLHLKFT